jgi:stage II sporulation protein D
VTRTPLTRRGFTRATLLALGAIPLLRRHRALAQDDVDPATWSQRPQLRVLLGSGDAQAAPAGEGFVFEGRPYRGRFTRVDGQIVNVIDLEQYLYGVVPHEMSARWPAAALQAQAVCARTYVLQRSDPRRAYDLIPSQLDQVYEGVAGESPAGIAAVDATAGQVLTFGSGFAQVAYSSCCGGHTEASSDAWGGLPLPYLGGVVCTWCGASPNFRWTVSIGFDDIAERFATQLAPWGNLNDLRITAEDPSGRARAFELVADRGSTVVKGSAFRLELGPRLLRSLLITGMQVAQPSRSVALQGSGLGHGVGMCQWGAQGMALAGRSVSDILAFYFPGTNLAAFGR